MGKTTLLVDIIKSYYKKLVTRILVVCPTFDVQDTFDPIRRMVPPFNWFKGDDENTFADIFDIIRFNPEPTLIVVDDMSGTKAIHGNRKGHFANLAIAVTHWNTSLFVITHQPTSVSPNMRDNTENIIIFPSEGEDDVKWLKRAYTTIAMNKKLMEEMIALAWRGINTDTEWGKHFLFIHAAPREPSRFFIDFDYEIKTRRK